MLALLEKMPSSLGLPSACLGLGKHLCLLSGQHLTSPFGALDQPFWGSSSASSQPGIIQEAIGKPLALPAPELALCLQHFMCFEALQGMQPQPSIWFFPSAGGLVLPWLYPPPTSSSLYFPSFSSVSLVLLFIFPQTYLSLNASLFCSWAMQRRPPTPLCC